MDRVSVQQAFAPSSICFGCGPANEEGLQIESYRIENGLRMEFTPEMSIPFDGDKMAAGTAAAYAQFAADAEQ